MNEEDAYGLLRLGKELLEGGNPAQAAVVLERARSSEPRRGSILEVLGRAYFGYGRYPDAARSFQEALEVDPTNHYAHYCLGLCLLKMKYPTRASAHFKMAWSMKPDETYREMAVRFGARCVRGPGSA